MRPLKNMRFTDSVIRILNNVIELSSERKQVEAFFGGSSVLPALKVQDFHFTSGTEF
jgi:predicted Zn-dependent protease